MAKYTICQRCNQTEQEHCSMFDPYDIPDGCQCDPRDWRDNKVTPICKQFTGTQNENCEKCEHGIECHNMENSGKVK